MKKGLAHFALKTQLYTKSLMTALDEVRKIHIGAPLKFNLV